MFRDVDSYPPPPGDSDLASLPLVPNFNARGRGQRDSASRRADPGRGPAQRRKRRAQYRGALCRRCVSPGTQIAGRDPESGIANRRPPGLHPSLKGFAELLDARRLAIVQGVGYPNPDRSHFSSMDIWHTARRQAGSKQTGWLGRYLDEAVTQAGGDIAALHYGPEKQPWRWPPRDVHCGSR